MSAPSNAGEMPIGEAPAEPTAEDIFLRGTKVLLGQGEVAVDIGQFYSRSDTTQLAVVGDAVGLATIRQTAFTTLFSARVGILDETEAFISTIFRSQNSDVFSGSDKIAEDHLSEFGDIRLGVRRTLLTEAPGRPTPLAAGFRWSRASTRRFCSRRRIIATPSVGTSPTSRDSNLKTASMSRWDMHWR
jgi:hypothetical protein